MLTCFWSQWSAFYHIKTYANSTLKSGKKLQQVKGLESKQKLEWRLQMAEGNCTE